MSGELRCPALFRANAATAAGQPPGRRLRLLSAVTALLWSVLLVLWLVEVLEELAQRREVTRRVGTLREVPLLLRILPQIVELLGATLVVDDGFHVLIEEHHADLVVRVG